MLRNLVLFFAAILLGASCFMLLDPGDAIPFFWRLWTRQPIVQMERRSSISAQFATPDGKPMANAEVRAFAPGEPNRPAVTGRTDAEGKFAFDPDRDGFWSAEAHSPDYVARIMIRVERNK
jgi:Domain of unknown function (DUF4198)